MIVCITSVCMLVYVHTYLCMYVCMFEKYMYSKYVCIYVCMYVYMWREMVRTAMTCLREDSSSKRREFSCTSSFTSRLLVSLLSLADASVIDGSGSGCEAVEVGM